MIDQPRVICWPRQLAVALVLPLAVWFAASITSLAAAPDLTTGGVPTDTLTVNLGPTGARGWVYHSGSSVGYTGDSRQIQITAVDAGSPAAGILAANDVILGANGTGGTPVNFTSDARRSLALAIADAEARNPGILKLIRWRAGVTSMVDVTLRTMGAYTTTAPYNCPKSAKILQEGMQYVFDHETSGRYSFGALALLASGNAAYQARVQTEARALIPSAATMVQMKSDVRDTASTWERGHTLIFLSEYYLATNDAQVIPAIEAYAVNIAKNQSLFGTLGHIYADKNKDGSNNGPMGGVYGVVNSTGLPCFFGLLLARECGLTNPEIEPAITRTSRFFSYYTGKGAIPYGEHEPYYQGHENNGKSGLAALAFALQTNRAAEEKFFTKMALASPSEREAGHTGPFFNYLWAPLGANCGGEDAAAAYFSRASWHFDLARRWDGSFAYDSISGDGPDSGAQYNDFRMSTAALLTYALPLRKLHLTGRSQNPARWLTSTDIAEAGVADSYDGNSRNTSQLITDLGSWSPKVRRIAAEKLKTSSVSPAQLDEITALANDINGTSRAGACLALGFIANATSATTLATLLTDPDKYVRFCAAEGLRYMTTAAKTAGLNTILAAAASTGQPLTPYVEDDPLQFAHGRLAMLLFYSGNAYGPKGILSSSLTGVDRNLLYPAIRSVSGTPTGLARSTVGSAYKLLLLSDTTAVADAIVQSVIERAPADKMFSSGVRQSGIETLQKYGFAEGVPLSMIYMDDDGRDSSKQSAIGVLKNYAGSCRTVVPDPNVIGFLQAMLNGANAVSAQAALDAIVNDPNPATLTPLKSIQSALADAPSLTLPANSTVLRVNATDLAKGDTIYTWRKVYGAGGVSFTPNGTAASANTTIQIGNIPGHYLFEVTMSDSRGLTEVYRTVPVTLYNSSGQLPPNFPPTASSQALGMIQGFSTPIALSGSDPEGYAMTFSVTGQPAHGKLTGSAPNLTYTPDVLYAGTDFFTFTVMDSEGQTSSAMVNCTIGSAALLGVAVYEPFAYPAGGLNGASGGSEVGLQGQWMASTSAQVVASGLAISNLPASGGAVGNLNSGSNNFGGARSLRASALAEKGLLADGATLWFSLAMGYDTGGNVTNSRLAFALANSQFSSGNYQYYILNEGSQLGSGLGVTLGNFSGTNGIVAATQFRDSTFGTSGSSGNIFGTTSSVLYSAGQYGLIVGKITWGAASDTIELYQPAADLNLPATPFSTLTVSVNQSTFDTITFSRGDKVVLDEIRFGSTYASVILGTTTPTDYGNWASKFFGSSLGSSTADLDGDGLTNDIERIFGLDPTKASSAHPIKVVLSPTTGTFSYTRRTPILTGFTYKIWTSTDLLTWAEDTGAGQTPGTPVADVETVAVTLSQTSLTRPRLFFQVRATKTTP